MSTMQTPPPDAPLPEGPPERRCPRCGSTLAPDQEWCLACGAAAGTEVVEAPGWRVPLYLGGALVALAIIGVIIAIVALSDQTEESPRAGATPSPAASVPPPGATPSVSPIPSTPTPIATPTTDTGTTTPEPSPTQDPLDTPTPDPTVESDTGSAFPGWSGNDGDYTVIIESAKSQAAAEKVAEEAQNEHSLSPGILESSDYSSLNGGYWVVFSGTFATKSEAETELESVRDSYSDAYVRQISNS